MGRAKKNVLNQTNEEPIKEEVVETEEISIDDTTQDEITEEKGIFDDREPDFSDLENALKTNSDVAEEIVDEILEREVESPVYDDDGEIDGEKEEIIEEPKQRTIESLSAKEFRFYQRTGIMPK